MNGRYWSSFFIALLLFLSGKPAQATFIVVRQTLDEIVAGADSFRVMDDNTSKTGVCKIHRAGDVFYARAGIGAFNSSGRELFSGIIGDGLNKSGSLLNKVDSIADRLLPALEKILEQYRKQSPDELKIVCS